MNTGINVAAHLPQQDGSISLPGLQAPLAIHRDQHGIAHVEASNEHDAWFGMGYTCAQDRLWQMEWYRRRGTGRWAEVAGKPGLPADRLFRRFRLDDASRADVAELTAETLAMFEAYAAGVNAYVDSGQPLPPEYGLTGTPWERWEPWQSILVFKVRHAIMGKRLSKIARLEILARTSPETYALLEGIEPAGTNVILPPAGATSYARATSAEEARALAAALDTLAVSEGGSNSWAVHGSRTTTGKPVLCNDSHRPLDVPNVYWQAHVTCPEFNVAGAAFPGFPAFPHFGFNGDLGWNITHGQADYQDLWLEAFDPADPTRYRTEDGWAQAEVTRAEIRVKDGPAEPVTLVRTRHGDVVHGDPASGRAIAVRYTATDRPNRQWETLRPMLLAKTVPELHETQRGWEEPVNAILSADAAGNIGFLYRGRIPVRSSRAGSEFPVPGWTGELTWQGDVPFEQLPQSINPSEGFLGTANQRPTDADEPYLAHEFATPGRSTRIAELLQGDAVFTPQEIAEHQADTTSVRARGWAQFLATQGPFEGDAERARSLLAAWSGDLAAGSAAALLYACARVSLVEAVFRLILGEEAWAYIFSGENDNAPQHLSRWMYYLGERLPGSAATPDGRPWGEVLPAALAAAWARATELGGSEPAAWRWGEVHRTSAQHSLAAALPDLAAELNPPSVGVGGDSDTLQVAGYSSAPGTTFALTNLSVYRQVVDFAADEPATWIIPGGASGIPGSRHYADQLEAWRAHQRVPVHHAPERMRAAAATTLTLQPTDE